MWASWNYPLLQTITSAFTLSSLRFSWIKLVLQSATPVTWRTSWNQGKKVPWEKSHLTVSDGHLCANLLAFLHTSFPLPMPGQWHKAISNVNIKVHLHTSSLLSTHVVGSKHRISRHCFAGSLIPWWTITENGNWSQFTPTYWEVGCFLTDWVDWQKLVNIRHWRLLVEMAATPQKGRTWLLVSSPLDW